MLSHIALPLALQLAKIAHLQSLLRASSQESEMGNFCGGRIPIFYDFGLSTWVCNNAIMNSVTIFISMKIYNIGGDGHGTSKCISE